MATNPERRSALLDAAIDLLGSEGARSLTYRKLDARAGVPVGTATNYFASRADLLLAVAGRVFERLTPDPARVDRIASTATGPDAVAAFSGYLAERLLADRSLGLALIELRLAAARDADVAAVVGPFLRGGLAEDQRFHAEGGLPGGLDAVELQHYAVLGLVLDKLTVPLTDRDPVELAGRLAVRMAGTGNSSSPR